jgi:sugar phosphate permease
MWKKPHVDNLSGIRRLDHIMSNQDQSKVSVRGFSMNRFAYCLAAVSALLLALYLVPDTYFGNKKIMGVAFVLTILVLPVCLLTPRTVRNRWLPFLIALILLFIHGLFIPHL